MIVFLPMRSAMTPPASENTIAGSMDDNITQVRARGEFVMSYMSHPRATISICMAKDAARLDTQTNRKSEIMREENIPRG